MEVTVKYVEPKILLVNRVDHATQEVGMQGMDADNMDKSTHMTAPTFAVDAPTLLVDSSTTIDANFNNHSSCLSTFFDSIQVSKSPPGCLIQVRDITRLRSMMLTMKPIPSISSLV